MRAQAGFAMLILLAGLILAGLFLTGAFMKTSGELGEKGASIEEKASKGAPLGPRIIEVVGYAGNGGAAIENITKLMITVSLAPGGSSIPYGDITISYRSKELFIPQVTYNKDLDGAEFSTATDNDLPDFGVIPIKEDTKNNNLDEHELIELHFWIEDKDGDHPIAQGEEFLIGVKTKGVRPSEFEFLGRVPKKVNTLYILKWE